MTSFSFSQKKELFDHIVDAMKEHKLHVVKFEGLEITKVIHEEPQTMFKLDLEKVADTHSADDEDLYWSTEA